MNSRLLLIPINWELALLTFVTIVVLSSSCKEKQSEELTAPITEINPFEEYLLTPDSAYKYELVSIHPNDEYDLHVLRLISQQWLSNEEVKNPIWWHWLTLVVPKTISSDTSLLWIGGGSRDSEPPKEADLISLSAALETNTITANLHNIPNQPIEFNNDTFGPRIEDELIAYGWDKFLDGGANSENAKWLARLPMTKAVMRAMDATCEYVNNNLGRNIAGFTLAGASKRGWTTWTTAVFDPRVVAIAPVVIDLLNVIPSFQHHWQVYGFWAPAVNDYLREGIMDRQLTSEYRNLVDLVEPFSYRHRLKLPKLMINASGDQFFLPDSWQFYWYDLPGEKHLRYVPNADHSLRKTDAVTSLVSFHHSITSKSRRPKYTWRVQDTLLTMEVDPLQPPSELILWSAKNENARDFRLEQIGPIWQSESITLDGASSYHVSISSPSKGWAAYFLEATYESANSPNHKFTSGIKVLPDSLPYPPHQPQ